MEIYYFLILLVIFCPTMTYNTKRNIKYNIKKIQKCEKIKCPPIDDPVCVKINKNHTKDDYVIATNKCEIKYINCHKDVEVAIVPMVNCLHVGKKYQNITRQRHKRDADDSEDEDGITSLEIVEPLLDEKEDNEDEVNTLSQDQSEESEGFNDAISKADNDLSENQSEIDVSKYNDADRPNENYTLNNDKEENDNDENIELNENDIPRVTLLENVGSDYEQIVEKVDFNENNKNCPTVCPSRDVMVCAKCHHNIHRTFLSLCHLRKFECEHPKEKLQLVKREPCVQSAPFISEINKTKGRIPESGEDDKLHKFIFCREEGLLNKDDSRCKSV